MPANVILEPMRKKGSLNSKADLLNVNKLANKAKRRMTNGTMHTTPSNGQ